MPNDEIGIIVSKAANEIEKRFYTQKEKDDLNVLLKLLKQPNIESFLKLTFDKLKEKFENAPPHEFPSFEIQSIFYEIIAPLIAESENEEASDISQTAEKLIRVYISVMGNIAELTSDENAFAKNKIKEVISEISFAETGDANNILNTINLDRNLQINKNIISLEDFIATLRDFANSISSESRMHFWKNSKGTYTWKPSPEETAKQFLITALINKFGTSVIEVQQEATAGAGFIDLLITINNTLKLVVELKLCGNGYSSTYAIAGEDQLVHYMNNKGVKTGILIVFDSRINDFAVGLIPEQTIDNLKVYTVAVDMAPKINKRNRKIK